MTITNDFETLHGAAKDMVTQIESLARSVGLDLQTADGGRGRRLNGGHDCRLRDGNGLPFPSLLRSRGDRCAPFTKP